VNDHHGYGARERGLQRLSALTVGITAASLVGVGAVVAYDAHALASTGTSASTGSSTGSAATDDGTAQYGDDGSTGSGAASSSGGSSSSSQVQPSTSTPVTTNQLPQATSGGS
jgi:hypothetical protein